MQGQYNMRSPAVKRLMKEAQELREPTELYHAQPLEDNLFEWHFTLRGPEDSDFDGGLYHGRIILPPEYPMKPPSIILLTPNGRFETFKKICLSISGHHPESWQPSWSIRTALLAIIGFMPTHGGGAIGSLDYTPEERKVLAKKSQDWKCSECGDVSQKLKPKTEASEKAAQEARELAAQINFQGEKQGGAQAKTTEENATTPTTPTATTTTPSDPSTHPTPATHPGAAPPQPPFSYPWPMPPGWGGHPGLPSPMTLGAMTVHRFPYPPPMMLAPPHAMFSAPSQSGGGGPRLPMPPFQLGLRFPAMPAAGGATGGGGGAGPQTVGDAAPSATLASQPASAPSEARPSPPPAPAVTPSSTTTTTTPTSTASPPASPQTTAAAATSPTSSATTTTATAVTAAAASSTSAPVSASATTTTTATTAASSSSSSSSSSGPTAAPATELRQRSTTAQPHAVGAQQPVVSSAPTGQQPVVSSAPTGQQTQWGYSPSTVVMMVLLSLAITLLLGRRMYMQFLTKDFWGAFQ